MCPEPPQKCTQPLDRGFCLGACQVYVTAHPYGASIAAVALQTSLKQMLEMVHPHLPMQLPPIWDTAAFVLCSAGTGVPEIGRQPFLALLEGI